MPTVVNSGRAWHTRMRSKGDRNTAYLITLARVLKEGQAKRERTIREAEQVKDHRVVEVCEEDVITTSTEKSLLYDFSSGEEEERGVPVAPANKMAAPESVAGKEAGTPSPLAPSSALPPRPPPKQGKRIFTMEEVRRHNKPDDAWLVAHGVVFDVSTWQGHPGGRRVLELKAGTDVTPDYDLHYSKKLWNRFEIGKLDTAGSSCSIM
ncbi:Nitrate reductase [Diplonema papillatum]|nr:Nitrate reductase [Diplonema papillatum]